mmetsp:Transcript_11618/g.17520  ORF Transcript_11618/g.17520 Transcript_11618/m.17520 type:complete len:349 (+) Transcript_11618:2-1048(+)
MCDAASIMTKMILIFSMLLFPVVDAFVPQNVSLNRKHVTVCMKNEIFDEIVNSRSACTRFKRHSDEKGTGTATQSDSDVVKLAFECLNLARRSPSGFNSQPYRAVLVSSPEAKMGLSKYCLGRNADRVRDSDCTVVFLADKECGRDGSRFGNFVRASAAQRRAARARLLNDELQAVDVGLKDTEGLENTVPQLSKFAEWKVRILVMLFSSGYPIPRIIASPISFCVRLGVSVISVMTRRKILVPSLSGAEAWSIKNTSLFAMTYMLAASSRGLATCPMEGFNAGGVRKALKIPRRYAVPLIVSTGIPYQRDLMEGEDDVGMCHGVQGGVSVTLRYPAEEVIYEDTFQD